MAYQFKSFENYTILEQKILILVNDGKSIDFKDEAVKKCVYMLCSLDYPKGEPPLYIKSGSVYPTVYFPETITTIRGKIKKAFPKNSTII